MFGMEAALFFLQERWRQTALKLRIHATGEQIIADKYAHVYL
jgi:hypothetical protein